MIHRNGGVTRHFLPQAAFTTIRRVAQTPDPALDHPNRLSIGHLHRDRAGHGAAILLVRLLPAVADDQAFHERLRIGKWHLNARAVRRAIERMPEIRIVASGRTKGHDLLDIGARVRLDPEHAEVIQRNLKIFALLLGLCGRISASEGLG